MRTTLIDSERETPRGAANDAAERDTRLRPGYRLPGTRIELRGLLGTGASAFVFHGVHLDLERPLAVKVQRPDLTWPGADARFVAEARMTSALRSPYVVETLDVGTLDDGRLFSAMEFLDGETLGDTLARGPLRPERCIGLLRMACKALHAVHTAGIVHRDIKPDNMMLVERGGTEHLVLLDFWVATRTGRDTQECCGTPRYMAPEQIRRQPVDGRADLYALGCCAFEMLTGCHATRGGSIDEVLSEHLEGVRPSAVASLQAPAPLIEVIERCLDPDPQRRYPSAADLEAALIKAQLAAGLRCPCDTLPPPPLADAQTRRRLMRDLARPPRHRWGQAAAMLGALALGIAAVL